MINQSELGRSQFYANGGELPEINKVSTNILEYFGTVKISIERQSNMSKIIIMQRESLI